MNVQAFASVYEHREVILLMTGLLFQLGEQKRCVCRCRSEKITIGNASHAFDYMRLTTCVPVNYA